MKNIYLIGLPGCGKTTVGNIVAKKLNMELVDMDALIVEKQGMSINEIFETDGEDFFRQVESEVLTQLSKTENKLISTGGGVVKLPQNRELLKSGRVVYIYATVEEIAKRSNFSDRPLLKDNIENLKNLFEQRKELYKECADVVVLSEGDPYIVAQNIIYFIKG